MPEIISRGGPAGGRGGSVALLRLLLAASGRLYGALLVLYPKAFRRRYAAEMRRDFRELMREGLEEGGATELVRVLAQAHSDLVLTALKERGTTAARRYAYYLSVEPRIAARAEARAMVAVVLVAVGVSWASFLQTPTYETSAHVLVDKKQGDQHGGELFLTEVTWVIDSRDVAEEVIQRLELQMKPAELLDKLTVEPVEGTSFLALTYEDTDPERAKLIVNTVGNVSEHFSERSNWVRATVWEKAAVPESPVSPHPLRNGLLALVIGLSAMLALALPRPLAAKIAGNSFLGGRIRLVRQGVGQAGLPFAPSTDPSEADVIKEKELLQALARSGKLTAAGAALVTSLSVAEAERMLSELATRGHLEVTVEHGKLLYSFWGEDEA